MNERPEGLEVPLHRSLVEPMLLAGLPRTVALVLWTSVGCVHTFVNVGNAPVRWLETFAPIPPAENVFRFMRDWDKRARELEG